MAIRLLIILVPLYVFLNACGRNAPAETTSKRLSDTPHEEASIERRIDDLVRRMSLAEKVGQMTQVSIHGATPENIRRYRFGSVLNGGGNYPQHKKDASAREWTAFADTLWHTSMEPSPSGVSIPIIWGTDAVHGHNNKMGATIFPHNIGVGAANDPDMVEDIAHITAKEVAATGVDWTFAPVVAVPRDLRWGRVYESYAQDPQVVARLGRRAVKGFQGELTQDRIVATAKHYVGDGGTRNGVDQGDTLCDDETLRRIHLPGYVAAIDAGVQTVMVSFSSVNGEKMHGHRYLIQDVLKDELGFDGIVVSDWNGIGQVPGCSNRQCAPAVNAGIDMFMVPFENDWTHFIPNLIEMVERGEVAEARIDDAVRRILRVKLRAGLFDKPPSKRALAGQDELLGAPEHRALARKAVRKSLVLLKNSDGILPLSPKSRVLVAGSAAHDISRQTGGWSLSWQGTGTVNEDFPGATTIWQGIEQMAATAVFDPDGHTAHPENHDVAVVVIGEVPYAEYEGDIQGGRTLEHAASHPEDLAIIERIHRSGVPLITVVLSGRPLYINRELNRSQGVVAAWLPGSEGIGVADVLFADEAGHAVFAPVGRLPFFWPATPCQASADTLANDNPPLFPEGYGLTYGDICSLGDDLDTPLWDEYGCTGNRPDDMETTEPLVLLGSGADPHWRPWFGDPTDWSGAAGIPGAAIPNVSVTAEDDANGRQWAARRILFTDEGYWGFVGEPIDTISYYMADYDVVFDARLNAPVVNPLKLEITCTYPCIDRSDLTSRLQDTPINEWVEIRIPLKQFSKSDFGNISSPFTLSARGPIDITVANIRWEKRN